MKSQGSSGGKASGDIRRNDGAERSVMRSQAGRGQPSRPAFEAATEKRFKQPLHRRRLPDGSMAASRRQIWENVTEPTVRSAERVRVTDENSRLLQLSGDVEAARLDRDVVVAHVIVRAEEAAPEHARGGPEQDEDGAEPLALDDDEQVDVGILARIVGRI